MSLEEFQMEAVRKFPQEFAHSLGGDEEGLPVFLVLSGRDQLVHTLHGWSDV